jgi:hypothetical protein
VLSQAQIFFHRKGILRNAVFAVKTKALSTAIQTLGTYAKQQPREKAHGENQIIIRFMPNLGVPKFSKTDSKHVEGLKGVETLVDRRESVQISTTRDAVIESTQKEVLRLDFLCGSRISRVSLISD